MINKNKIRIKSIIFFLKKKINRNTTLFKNKIYINRKLLRVFYQTAKNILVKVFDLSQKT